MLKQVYDQKVSSSQSLIVFGGCQLSDVKHVFMYVSGVLQLLTARTSRKFLACRLTPDMETKLLFMTSRVTSHVHWVTLNLWDEVTMTSDPVLLLRCVLGSRSGIRTGFRDSTCPRPRANHCAAISFVTSVEWSILPMRC